MIAKPSEDNQFLAAHILRLRSSYRHWTRRDLVDPRMTDAEAARYVFTAPFALVSHGSENDPIFNYGNGTALSLFGVSWEEFTSMPSRLSAEVVEQEERERLLEEVTRRGYIDHYQGIRIARRGRRFRIRDAVVWNVMDEAGQYCGQAACFRAWEFLEDPCSEAATYRGQVTASASRA